MKFSKNGVTSFELCRFYLNPFRTVLSASVRGVTYNGIYIMKSFFKVKVDICIFFDYADVKAYILGEV